MTPDKILQGLMAVDFALRMLEERGVDVDAAFALIRTKRESGAGVTIEDVDRLLAQSREAVDGATKGQTELEEA